jgi:hypothetical protein
VRIAEGWREVDSGEELLRRIGSRRQQSLHQARRLRLALPLFLDRAPGTELLDTVMRSEKVRTILKRAMLLGLAAIDHPGDDAVEMVLRWLRDGRLRDQVLATVVRGQPAWMAALAEAEWLDEAWQAGTAADRDRLLDLLGAVSTRWGDGVAAHLSRWSQGDSTVLERAGWIFLHQASEDTDELFAMRLQYFAQTEDPERWIDWKKLLSECPQRVAPLLATLLERTGVSELCRRYTQGLLGLHDLPLQGNPLGKGAWRHLGPWWLRLEVSSLSQIRTSWHIIPGAILIHLVELIAISLAHDVTVDASFWSSLAQDLDPMRELDGWLLLRVGANLPDSGRSTAEALTSWFMSDRSWAHIRVGSDLDGKYELAQDFIARVGQLIPDEMLYRLETWIAEYRDGWAISEEEYRYESGLRPSRLGLTAYRLLPRLPGHRLSLNAQSLLRELERKYSGKLPTVDPPTGDVIRSPVPDGSADRWPVQEWINRLVQLNRSGRGSPVSAKWHQLDRSSTGVYDLESMVDQLRRLSEQHPQRYLDHAERFDDSIPIEARIAVLSSIARTEAPERCPDRTSWEPLDDELVAEVVHLPAYIDEPACWSHISWIVYKRPQYSWPDTVVDRIEALARGQTREGTKLGYGDLTFYRMNEDACQALEALAKLVQHHPERRNRVMTMSTLLVGHDNPGRRVSAAVAAANCYDSDPETAFAAVLKAAEDTLVAAQPDIIPMLLWIASRSEVSPPFQDTAKARLLALAADQRDWIMERGGQAAINLRLREVIDDEELDRYLNGAIDTRRGIAAAIAELLSFDDVPAWVLELAIRLANDPDTKTGNIIVSALGNIKAGRLVTDRSFVADLLATAAYQRNQNPVIKACDRQDQLWPIKDLILTSAENAARTDADRDDSFDARANRWEEVAGLVDLLARLVEEAERKGSFGVRSRALDAWDQLLESGVPSATRAFNARVLDST